MAAAFDLNKAGYWLVGVFVGVWVLALTIWRVGKVEHRWERAAAAAHAERALEAA